MSSTQDMGLTTEGTDCKSAPAGRMGNMKKTKAILIGMIYAMSMSACFYPIPTSIRNSFTYCYDGKYTGIDTLININGYYQQSSLTTRYIANGFFKPLISSIDTFYFSLIFYDNGLCRINFDDFARSFDSKGKFIDRPENLPPRNISLFFQKVSENKESPYSRSFYNDRWGVYRIYGDIIKILALHEGSSLNDSWYIIERQYKIVDKNTIQDISQKAIDTVNYPVTFMPTSVIPSYRYAWLLQYEWFWCNESDWKHYMESLKQDEK